MVLRQKGQFLTKFEADQLQARVPIICVFNRLRSGIGFAHLLAQIAADSHNSWKLMRFNPIPALDREREQDLFESVTEEEIIFLWRSIKSKGLSEDEAWQAIVTGVALDLAFARTKACKEIEH